MSLHADISPDDPTKIVITQFEWKFKELLHALPSSKYKDNGWYLNLSWQMCLALKYTFKQDLIIGPALQAWADKEYNEVIVPAFNLRSVPDAEGYPNLFPHQRGDVKFLATAKRALLANGMGSGKSQSAFSTVRYLHEQGKDVFPVLITCPNSTKFQWRDEINQVWPGLRVTIVDGTAAQRKKQLEKAKGGDTPCPVHSAIATETDTQTDSAEAATKKTSGGETQSMLLDSEQTATLGTKINESVLAKNDISGSNMESLSMSTTNGSAMLSTSANSALGPQKSSTIVTTPEESGASSASSATRRSRGPKKKSAGSKKPECTCPSHVTIINWESVRSHSRLLPYGSIALKKCMKHGGLDDKVSAASCEAHEKELNAIDFKSVIGDEIHRIKEASSKVARSFKAATGNADYRFALSGTPIASAPDDLYSILNWLYPHAYPSKSKYLDRFCQTHFNSWGAQIVIGIKPEMEQEFFAGIDPFLRRMPKEAILPFLPPILRQRRTVEMAAKQKKAYESMRDEMIAELDDSIVHTTSPLVKMGRLIQFASAYAEAEMKDIYNKETREVEKKLVLTLSDPSAKLDAFMDDLQDFGDESVVVFAASVQLIRLLSKRLEKAGIAHGLITGDQDASERRAHMANFQEGRTKYILCTIQAGGTGITLTKGSVMVFLQRSWSMIDNLQAEGRAHRIGSQIHDHVQIIDYVTEGTVEEEVFRAIEEKIENLEFILRDKELMKKVLENRPIDPIDKPVTNKLDLEGSERTLDEQ